LLLDRIEVGVEIIGVPLLLPVTVIKRLIVAELNVIILYIIAMARTLTDYSKI
jgi:hypothetical protein